MFATTAEIIATIALIAFALALGFALTRKVRLTFWPFVSVLATLLVLGAARFLPLLANLLEQPDEIFYLSWGRQLANFWLEGVPTEVQYRIWPGSGAWSAFIGLSTIVLGPATFFFIAVNAVFTSFSFLILQHAAFLLFGTKPKWIPLVVFLSNPALLLNGPTLLRESGFWLGTTLLILGLGFLARSHNIAGLFALLSGTVVVLAVRPNLGIFFVFMFLIMTSVTWTWINRYSGTGHIAGGLGIVGLLLILFPAGVEALSGRDDLPSYAGVAARELSDTASTGFRETVNDSTLGDNNVFKTFCTSNEYLGAACLSISHLPNFLFGPFPWELNTEPVWLYLIISTWQFLFVLGTSIGALVALRARQPAVLGLFVAALLLTLLLAVTLTNYGIVARFRTVVWLLLLPAAWTGIEKLGFTIRNQLRK